MVPLPTYSGRFTCPITSARVRTTPSTSAAARMAGSISLTAIAGPQAWSGGGNGAWAAARSAPNATTAIAVAAYMHLRIALTTPPYCFFKSIAVKPQVIWSSTHRPLTSRRRRRIDLHVFAMTAVTGRTQLLGVVAKLIDRGGLARVIGELGGGIGLA